MQSPWAPRGRQQHYFLKTLLGMTHIALLCRLYPPVQQSPSSGCEAPPSQNWGWQSCADPTWACWARFGQDWGQRRYPSYRHFCWPHSKARLGEWEQAVGEGKKHLQQGGWKHEELLAPALSPQSTHLQKLDHHSSFTLPGQHFCSVSGPGCLSAARRHPSCHCPCPGESHCAERESHSQSGWQRECLSPG